MNQREEAGGLESALGKVLVTGANGFTGAWFCQYLARKGVPTRAMYWAPDGAPDFSHPNLELVPGDFLDRESLKRALDGVETVQNIAALYRPTNVPQKAYWDVNVDGIRNIVEEAARAGVKRFVQCSTVGVHGGIDAPPAGEDAPIKPDDYYQETKYRGEMVVRELCPALGMAYSVVRPAAIYGPLETRFLKLARSLKRGTFVMFGSGEVRYHFIHVEDLSASFCLCAERDEALGEIFIIADDHALSLNEIVRVMSEALGIRPPRLRLPYPLLYGVAAACEFALKPFPVSAPLHRRRAAWFNATRQFDISKARQRLGYDPKIAPEDGLKEMVRSYQEAGWL
ncbi:MAG: NAD-dependent epimerase/dehydratase family protein [Gammaproteobacteria bacterium]